MPLPERRKDRKEPRHDERRQWQERSLRAPQSPDTYYHQPPPHLANPAQHPVNSYYAYPPNGYAYQHKMPDPTHPNYAPHSQPPQVNVAYQYRSYEQGPPPGHWGQQMPISPNK